MRLFHTTPKGFTVEQFDNLTPNDRAVLGIAPGSTLEAANKAYEAYLHIEQLKKEKKAGPVRDAHGHFIKKEK